MAWQFNQDVARIFPNHARQHIPNYDQVIDLTVSICSENLDQYSGILEVGCAVGETLSRLDQQGFKNLHGVDSSLDMLTQCPPKIANYYHSFNIPVNTSKYDAILCNWTLHFIENKIEYLKTIYENLNKDGFLIISDKTCTDKFAIENYYKWKKSQGVSDEEIQNKERSLEGVMFIQSPKWYMETLKQIGFHHLYIINAHWCFTTFFCKK